MTSSQSRGQTRYWTGGAQRKLDSKFGAVAKGVAASTSSIFTCRS